LKKSTTYLVLLFALCIGGTKTFAQSRQELNFNSGWKFSLGDQASWSSAELNDKNWRTLDLPHDWSIEGKFDKNHPATVGGGALPGGTGWYRKQFQVPASAKGKYIAIDFDGVYRNSEVWINGHYLGKRPNGYVAFRYDLSRYLRYGGMNTLAVKVDNAKQPNSRWYSGSGIYRDVKLVTLNPVHVEQWGSYVTTPAVTDLAAKVQVELRVNAAGKKQVAEVRTLILDAAKKVVASTSQKVQLGGAAPFNTSLELKNPQRWSTENPYLYTVQSQILLNGKEVDRYDTPLGIRTFSFDQNRGFSLNGKEMKIRGVCMHHDLGALGAAFNVRAAERQLEILKSMGVNGLRTSHNPPAKALFATKWDLSSWMKHSICG
jgi:beta-galactosidase